MSSGNEWFTPPSIIRAAKEVMGEINLDPASCVAANAFVQAERFYSKEDNGLLLPWFGNVWLNPPFGRTQQGRGSNLAHFTIKLNSEYQSGNVKQAILLIPTNTATSWFVPLWDYPICFPRRRIRFLQPDGQVGQGMSFPTCLVYLGRRASRFAEVFSRFGHIAVPDHQHSPRAIELWQARQEVIA
ncbi:MAG TPA: DNA N-6-adenine-methyltransferase [Ktedonobacteraceae bacterium]|nr:DNA N-6-adenine-methyltransferase [Ktedonobacteraceae bacterium]